MWNFMTQPGLATTIVDYTNDFWPLTFGLLGLVVLSAGLITSAAIRHHLSQKTTSVAEPVPTQYRKAA